MELAGKLLIATPGMEDPRFVKSVILVCSHDASGAMGLVINRPIRDLALADLLARLEITPGPHPRLEVVHAGGPVEKERGFVLQTLDGLDLASEALAIGKGADRQAPLAGRSALSQAGREAKGEDEPDCAADPVAGGGAGMAENRDVEEEIPEDQPLVPSIVVPGGFLINGSRAVLRALAHGGGPDGAILVLGYAGWAPGQLEDEIARNDWLLADGNRDLIFNTADHAKWRAALRSLGVDPVALSGTFGRA